MAATRLTQIIDGDLPGRFVWEDDLCVAFLSDTPITPGHTLVAPREQVDQWLDASPQLRDHLFEVAHTIGCAIQAVCQPTTVGLLIAGLEGDRMHIHLAAIDSMADMDVSRADPSPGEEALDAARDAIRGSLREMGAVGLSSRG